MSNTTAPIIDDNQEMKRKTKSAPFTYKSKNMPALVLNEDESNIVDIDYKIIQEDPDLESQVTPTRVPDELNFFEESKEIDEIVNSPETQREMKGQTIENS